MSTKIKELWKCTDCVCFDVDSTVITVEDLDELAQFCGIDVSSLTNESMCGRMKFEDCLTTQLAMIAPSLSQVQEFIENKTSSLSPGVDTLIDILHNNKIPVYLISGGFIELITPIAMQLNIPFKNVFANRFKFYFDGEYAGFDETSPTSRSGGKAIVINQLKMDYGYKAVVIIGDGFNDLEACPPADAFIGYGGNVVREPIQSRCKWYVMDFWELTQILYS